MTARQKERIDQLTDIINKARVRYHAVYESIEGVDQLTNREYDELLIELVDLEKETGYRNPASPTDKVGAEECEDTAIHFAPVLSLKSTKDIDEMQYFLGENEGVLTPKLDGISIVLYYEKGELIQALTRGNGKYGRVITINASNMGSDYAGVPKKLHIKDTVVIRGEGVISYKDFESLGDKYSNPRNAVASIMVNKNRHPSARLCRFFPYEVIYSEAHPKFTLYTDQLAYLKSLGFPRAVQHLKVLNFELKDGLTTGHGLIADFIYPLDGLVLRYNDIESGEDRGRTSTYPKHSMAYKWPDVVVETKVTGMKWSTSSNGLITPVVIFEPVELEGTIVKQANLHNLKKFEKFEIGIGDTLRVYKANKIIPEVEENLTRSGTEPIPAICGTCQQPTSVIETTHAKKLICIFCKDGLPF